MLRSLHPFINIDHSYRNDILNNVICKLLNRNPDTRTPTPLDTTTACLLSLLTTRMGILSTAPRNIHIRGNNPSLLPIRLKREDLTLGTNIDVPFLYSDVAPSTRTSCTQAACSEDGNLQDQVRSILLIWASEFACVR
ncbi:hypothetical protein AMTR_s00091p00074450 [Amborella trichopoda]|uniref:Uncharacterized protein n=1 Tax=Amborella trichopoda TaxID=13333 RepID=W1NZ57_AMBTC|nr:hypothetical protein AMTR_s00091p00074450 [Amborella trichopoda]